MTERARRAAEEIRVWMTDEITRRRRDGIHIDDVLGRLLDLKEDDGAPLDGETAGASSRACWLARSTRPLPQCRESFTCSRPIPPCSRVSAGTSTTRCE